MHRRKQRRVAEMDAPMEIAVAKLHGVIKGQPSLLMRNMHNTTNKWCLHQPASLATRLHKAVSGGVICKLGSSAFSVAFRLRSVMLADAYGSLQHSPSNACLNAETALTRFLVETSACGRFWNGKVRHISWHCAYIYLYTVWIPNWQNFQVMSTASLSREPM